MKGRVINIDYVEIYEIPYKNFSNLIDKWSKHEYIDHFLFYTKYKNKYLTIDNESGQCYTEEFDSKDKALCWLIRNDYSAEEISKLQDIEARHLITKSKYKVFSNKLEVQHGI